jgi:hypothetical protein
MRLQGLDKLQFGKYTPFFEKVAEVLGNRFPCIFDTCLTTQMHSVTSQNTAMLAKLMLW